MTHPDSPVPLDELLAHRAWVRRMAVALARNDAEADDLVQEAWLVALDKRPSSAASVRTWFATVLRRRLLNRRRADSRRASRETAAREPQTADDPADVVAHAELHRLVVESVLGLDEPYRTTVLLRFFEDLPPRAVAVRMGVPVETVRSRVQRGVAILRRRLDARHHGRRSAWAPALLSWSGTRRAGSVARASTTVGSFVTGGLMATTKWATAAVVLAVLGVAGVWVLQRDRTSQRETASPPGAIDDAASRTASASRRRLGDETSDAAIDLVDTTAAGDGSDNDGGDEPSSPQLPTLTVGGIVVEADTGAAIPGARVSVEQRLDVVRSGAVVTDTSGAFEITIPADAERVAIEAEGFVTRRVSPTAERPDGSPLRVVLTPAGHVVGRAVLVDGSPASGAEASVYTNWDDDDGHQWFRSVATVTADGAFDVGGLAPGRRHALVIRSGGSAPGARTVDLPRVRPFVVDAGLVVLPAPRRVTGRAVRANGSAGSDLVVELERTDELGLTFGLARTKQTTDAEGRFTFDDLAPGAYAVRVPKVVVFPRRTHIVVLTERDPEPLTLTLGASDGRGEPVRMSALVCDEFGAPVPGVEIRFGYAANGATSTVASAADGSVTLDAAYEPVDVFMHLAADLARQYVAPSRVFLRPGDRNVRVVLRRGERLGGVVRDATGSPVADARVRALDGSRSLGGTIADGQGRFDFAVPPGRNLVVEAAHPPEAGRLDRRVGVVSGVATGRTDLVVCIPDDVSLRGLRVAVVDASGRPVESAQVDVDFAGADPLATTVRFTSRSGIAELEDLPNAPVTISVRIAGTASNARSVFALASVRVAGDVNEVLIVAQRGRTISGRVLRSDGAPEPGAFVHASLGGADCRTFADTDGRFELEVPIDVNSRFAVLSNPFPPDPNDPRAGWDLVDEEDRDLEIVLRPVPTW